MNIELLTEWFKNLLATNGPKTFAIALACFILAWLDKEDIYKLSPGIKETVIIAGVISFSFAVVNMALALWLAISPRLKRTVWEFQATKKAKAYFPY